MELNVCWMYHDIMDLYGDKGNMMVLQKRCEERGISITIDTLSIGDQRDLRAYDLLFLGGGADKEQMMLIDDLLSRREHIREAMEQRTFVLLICGGYQLFGQYYISADTVSYTHLDVYKRQPLKRRNDNEESAQHKLSHIPPHCLCCMECCLR